MFHVVLVQPEIPPNTGNIGRLCLATGATLHLIEPLGFSLDEPSLKRAGLDYWKEVKVCRWPCWESYWEAVEEPGRVFLLTTKASRAHWDFRYRPGDHLVFGRETRGLPESLLGRYPEQCATIPMRGTRSLNLATAVAIVLYEAVRQNQF